MGALRAGAAAVVVLALFAPLVGAGFHPVPRGGQSGPASAPTSAPASAQASAPALSLQGQLVDHGGVPLAGVEVTAVPPAPAPARKAVTDAHGVFSLVGLPAGEVQLRIAHMGSYPAPNPSRVVVEAGAADVQIKARPLPVLRGVVMDEKLRAVGDSEVVLKLPDEVVIRTDPRGSFTATLAPPKDGLMLIARNSALGLAGFAVWEGAVEMLRVTVAPSVTVSGVVRRAAGEGVKGVRVRLVGVKGAALGALGAVDTDEKGAFVLALLPPGLSVKAIAGAGPTEVVSEVVVTGAAQSKPLVLVVPR